VQQAFKTIYRYKLRIDHEKRCRKILLQKASRTDILSGEASLSESEKKKLEELDQISIKLDVQIKRLDAMIQKLCDY
jgi:flagellar motor switch/type III secretory pathway protein FliN